MYGVCLDPDEKNRNDQASMPQWLSIKLTVRSGSGMAWVVGSTPRVGCAGGNQSAILIVYVSDSVSLSLPL